MNLDVPETIVIVILKKTYIIKITGFDLAHPQLLKQAVESAIDAFTDTTEERNVLSAQEKEKKIAELQREDEKRLVPFLV